MSDRFDPEILFSLVPSFYRNNLGADDRKLIETVWDGLVRCVDAEYAAAYQIAQSVRPADVPVKTFYPWVFHRFSDWTTRKARHQHVVMRMDGNAYGRFPFLRFVDLASAKVYYAGTRREIESPWVLSNDPDPVQLFISYNSYALTNLFTGGAGFVRYVGTRLRLQSVVDGEFVDAADFASGSEVVVESASEWLRNQITGNGVLTGYDAEWFHDDFITRSAAEIDAASAEITLRHQCLWMFVTHASNGVTGSPGLEGVSVDDPSAEYPTITWPGGFRKGQVLEFIRFGAAYDIQYVNGPSAFRYREVVDADGSTYTIKRSKTDSRSQSLAVVNLVLDIPLYPAAVEVEAQLVRFPKALPVGVRVRVEDASGAQSFESDGQSSSFSLDRQVDPDVASVYVYNIDLTEVSVSSTRFELGRPLPIATVVEFAAPYHLPHDHARYTTTILAAAAYVDLPASRPMALTAGLAQDARYPVKVYVDGVLQPTTAYTFPSTTRVQKASGNYAVGQVIDVVYTDAEEVGDHVHARFSVDVADGDSLGSVSVTGISSRYPIEVETVEGTLVPGADTPLHVNRIVRITPDIAGPAKVYVDGAEAGQHFEAVLPARIDEDEAYVGTLDAADSMQDGIDAPTEVASGVDLALSRSGVDTLVRSSVAIEKAWFKNAYVDEHLIQNNLGLAVGVTDGGESTQRYKDAVLALFSAMWSNSSVATIENFACIVLGSAYCPAGVNRGIRRSGLTRVRAVEVPGGAIETAALREDIPDRQVGAVVPRLFAVSAFASLVDLEDVPALPFFAEDFSPDYRCGKRLDVRTPREITGVVDSFSADTFILESVLTDFIENEVWVGDLIRLTVTGEADPVFGRVAEVLDAHHLRLREAPANPDAAGYGELSYGTPTGYGGTVIGLAVTAFTLWTRSTRMLDVGLYLDEMLRDAIALADGEAYETARTRLVEVLRHHVFALRIDWDATTDQAALGYLKVLLERAKPAETRAIAYTEVNDGQIEDSFTGTVADHGVQVTSLWRSSVVGASYVGYAFAAASVAEIPVEPDLFGPDWWIP